MPSFWLNKRSLPNIEWSSDNGNKTTKWLLYFLVNLYSWHLPLYNYAVVSIFSGLLDTYVLYVILVNYDGIFKFYLRETHWLRGRSGTLRKLRPGRTRRRRRHASRNHRWIKWYWPDTGTSPPFSGIPVADCHLNTKPLSLEHIIINLRAHLSLSILISPSKRPTYLAHMVISYHMWLFITCFKQISPDLLYFMGESMIQLSFDYYLFFSYVFKMFLIVFYSLI